MEKQQRISCSGAVSVTYGGNTYVLPGGDYSLDELSSALGELPSGVTVLEVARHAQHQHAGIVEGDTPKPNPVRLYVRYPGTPEAATEAESPERKPRTATAHLPKNSLKKK